MRKITLLFLLMFGFTTIMSAQCLSSDNGQWPSNTYTISTCDGLTQNSITTCGYASEYSVVTVIQGETYTFGSSVTTDIVTISTDSGATAETTGTGSVTWVATVSGDIYFYTHLDDGACGGEQVCRTRYVICGTPPTCIAPTGTAISNLTSSTATISWDTSVTDPGNGYEYYLSTSNTAPLNSDTATGAVGAGITTVDLTSLTPATVYYVWIRSVCSSTDSSNWSTVASFKTLCVAYTPTFTEDFTTFLPNCWSRSGAGDVSTGPTGTANGIWTSDGFLNVGSTGAVKVNLYSLNRVGWLISPLIDMSAGNYRVKFDYGVTAWNSTTSSAMGSDDKVQLLASQDGGLTWTSLVDFTANSNVSNTLNNFILEIPSYTSANTLFALYATDGANDDTQDYDFFIDNFVVETIPVCDTPSSVNASGVLYNSATISWAAPTATPLTYEYVLDTNVADPLSGTSLNALTYTTTSLLPTTTYYFHIRSNCSTGVYSNWVTVSFTTPATPPANDDCINAIALTPGAVFADHIASGTILAATTTNGITPTCQSSFTADVWYSLVVPASGSITIETQVAAANSMSDSVVAAFTGSCGSLTQIGCDDDGGPSGANNFMSILSLTGLTPNNTIYIGVWKYGTAAPTSTNSEFLISAYDASLASNTFENAKFNFYPNPVKDVLNISNATTISKVQVINLLGQEMVVKNLNETQGQIDMSQLSAGTYLVKVTSDNQTKTIKVVKE